jgi:hypothetical protein
VKGDNVYITIEHNNQYTEDREWMVAVTDDGILIFSNTKLITDDPVNALAYVGILQNKGHELDQSYDPTLDDLCGSALIALKERINKQSAADVQVEIAKFKAKNHM